MRKYRTNHDKILCFNLEPFSFTNFSRIFPVLSVVLFISNVPLIFMSSSNFLGGFEFTLLIRGTLVRVWYFSGNFFFIFFVIFRRDFWAFLSIKIGFAWTWNSFSVPFVKLKIFRRYRKIENRLLENTSLRLRRMSIFSGLEIYSRFRNGYCDVVWRLNYLCVYVNWSFLVEFNWFFNDLSMIEYLTTGISYYCFLLANVMIVIEANLYVKHTVLLNKSILEN